MKAIGNIFVSWRKGKGSRRILVGEIKRNSTEGVRFSYIEEGVEEAVKQGFFAYEGFPNLKKVYTENVIDVFGQRLVRSERNDLDDFYSFWKINKKYIADQFYMLAYTQGILPTDNFEFLADFNPIKGLSFITELAGLSKTKISPEKLCVGDDLTYVLEKGNEYDKFAVKVYKEDLFIGRIKLVHCKVFGKSKSKLKIKVHHIEKNGILNRVFLNVSS